MARSRKVLIPYPILGHSGWRAGVAGADNLLGIVNLSASSAGRNPSAAPATPPADDADAPYAGPSDPRLTPVSGKGPIDPSGALTYETDSWRWNDPEAVDYDLYRKQQELAEAQVEANAAEAIGWGQTGAAALKPLTGVGVLGSLPAAVTAQGAGTYLNHVEIPMLQREVQALQARKAQLQGRSKS